MPVYEMESGIPLPQRSDRHKWPFRAMDAGTCIKISDKTQWKRACWNAHLISKRCGMKFVTRWDKEDGFGRIWRIR